MRFTTAWSTTAVQNTILRFVILTLGLLVLTFGLGLVKVSERDPLIIERACFNHALKSTSNDRTNDEIEEFVKLALEQRFNSDGIVLSDYLSTEEQGFREQEQKELATRQITQKIVVHHVKPEGAQASVDADRLVSVSQIRSAFAFPLKITLGSIRRSESNPYGLQIIKITQIKSDTK